MRRVEEPADLAALHVEDLLQAAVPLLHAVLVVQILANVIHGAT